MFLGGSTLDYSLLFTKIFVHLPIIAAACYFSVYKLIKWDPVNLYLFKIVSRNTRKRCGICPKLTINTVESRSGILLITLNIFHNFFSDSIVDPEQANVSLCKYCYSKSEDEQMLYLTSCRTAADFLKSCKVLFL